MTDDTRFERAVASIDAANGEDPNRELAEGREHPKELLYSRRMSAWLDRLAPDASEPLRLAVRCQHLRRWEMPRRDFAAGRQGYHAWRRACMEMHAQRAGEILREAGYDGETISRVKDLVRKRRLALDPEAQLLEDAACLVFLEHHLAGFAAKHDEEKLTGILKKTWKKMSPAGQKAALELDLSPRLRDLIAGALGR